MAAFFDNNKRIEIPTTSTSSHPSSSMLSFPTFGFDTSSSNYYGLGSIIREIACASKSELPEIGGYRGGSINSDTRGARATELKPLVSR